MGGNSSKESDPEPTQLLESTILDRGAKRTTTKRKTNFNQFGNGKKTQIINTTFLGDDIFTTIPEASTVTNSKPTLITSTKTKTTKTKSKATSTNPPHESENSSGSWKVHGGIALAIIVIIVILVILIKKSNKKSKKNDNIPTYENQNVNPTLKPNPPKKNGSEMYSGPIYDPSKESDYSTMNYNNTSMGVATSVEAATIMRKNEEIEAAAAAYSHATLPNYNSPQKEQSMDTLPQSTMAQTYNYGQSSYDLNSNGSYDQYNQTQPTFDNSYNQPQQTFDNSYNQPQQTFDNSYNQPQQTFDNSYNQPQQTFDNSYNQPQQTFDNSYNQPQQTYDVGYNQPQPAYDPAGFNQPPTTYDATGYNQPQSYDSNGYSNVNNSPYGAQYANYTPGVPSIDQGAMSSPLSLPVSTAGGVIVSATYASSQTTAVKQPDGTFTETVDYSTSNSYEVDKDYIAIYSYDPVLSDELVIKINDRIHLLEMYSDGWGYGKNVTTGHIGILPLNRLKVEEEKEAPVEKKIRPADISKRTVSMKVKKPIKENDDKKKLKKRYTDGDEDYNRKKHDDDDDYERRRERRRYDDDDDYERRRERRRHDDDDYERRRERRRHDDDDDYERRKDRRRYSDDDDDYERRRDRRRYSDDDDDYERRRDRRRYSDDDDDKKERKRRDDSSERKSIENRDIEKKSNEDKESKKSNENDSKKSNDNGIIEYEIKSYRRDN